MGLSAELKALVALALLTVVLYAPHLADPYVYQDANYEHTVSPLLWHSASLALHLVNGLLLFGIATSRKWPAPWLLTALFWWHPLNVEAVAYGAGQPELRISCCVLWLAWVWSADLDRRDRLGFTLAGLGGLWLTKAANLVRSPVLFQFQLSQGVSWVQWARWEATALCRYLALWIVPAGFSADHDVVHIAAIWQLLAVASVLSAAALLAWRWRTLPSMVRLGAAWVLILVAPRFALRLPLAILNEHHAYTLSPGFAALTTWTAARVGLV